MDLSQRMRLWADELRAIAREGLHWSASNPYDSHRYRRVLRIAAEIFAAQDTRSIEEIEHIYRDGLLKIGPDPVGDAAVINDRGEILLIQRSDDGLWAMPGGAFEVGETPAEGACREAFEETGLRVEPVALVGVYDSRLLGSRASVHMYQFTFLCRLRDVDAEPTASSEVLAVQWVAEADLPELSPGHASRIADAFRWWRGEIREAVFDSVSTRPGEEGRDA